MILYDPDTNLIIPPSITGHEMKAPLKVWCKFCNRLIKNSDGTNSWQIYSHFRTKHHFYTEGVKINFPNN